MGDRLAEVETLAGWLGLTTESINQVRAGLLLDAASALVRAYAKTDFSGIVPEEIQVVTLGVATRAYTNPNGFTMQTTGPYSVQYGADSAAGLALSDSDKEIIDGVLAGDKKRSAYWVFTPGGDRSTQQRYVPVADGGKPIPWNEPDWETPGFGWVR